MTGVPDAYTSPAATPKPRSSAKSQQCRRVPIERAIMRAFSRCSPMEPTRTSQSTSHATEFL